MKEILEYCLKSNEIDCIKLFNEIADMPCVSIHGPIHHFIMPAVLLTCYNNSEGSKEQLAAQLKEAEKRAETIPGANCAFCGYCGAAAGVAIFCSILTESGPLSEDSWSKVMTVSSLISLELAKNGGPRCCKRNAYLAMVTGAKEIEKHFGIKLKADMPVCKYFPKNKECRKEKCLFFPKKK